MTRFNSPLFRGPGSRERNLLFMEGYQAFFDNKTVHECPYELGPDGNDDHFCWRAGHHYALHNRQKGRAWISAKLRVGQCSTCKHWYRQDRDDGLGECRGAPPAALVNARGMFPLTLMGDCCGTYALSWALTTDEDAQGQPHIIVTSES